MKLQAREKKRQEGDEKTSVRRMFVDHKNVTWGSDDLI